MLLAIDDHVVEDARHLLTLLCVAKRPLMVEEVIEAIAVEFDDGGRLNRERRLPDAEALLEICPGFIDISMYSPSGSDVFFKSHPELRSDVDNHEVSIVTIAHYSVQEYLQSERISKSPAVSNFYVHSAVADNNVARMCLVYLLDPLSHETLDQKMLAQMPMAKYAAEFWPEHYRKGVRNARHVEILISQLFGRYQHAFENWVRLFDVDRRYASFPDIRRKSDDIPGPVYYASLLGYDETLEHLLKKDEGNESIHRQGGSRGSALRVAAAEGHESIVQLLLSKGADINMQSGELGDALQAASGAGHVSTVRLLLGKGADINKQGGRFGNALQTAASTVGININLPNNLATVQLLLERGADVNAQGGYFGSALQAASCQGIEAVQLLMRKGADVNMQGGEFGNALQAASFLGVEAVVELLLEEGAEINAQGGYFGNALQAASYQGVEAVVELLLRKGADINIQGGCLGNALWAASHRGHEPVVQLLLDGGVDVDSQGGSALRAAQKEGHTSVVQLLLNAGANARRFA